MSVRHSVHGGPHVTIIHVALNLSVQGPRLEEPDPPPPRTVGKRTTALATALSSAFIPLLLECFLVVRLFSSYRKFFNTIFVSEVWCVVVLKQPQVGKST